MEDLAKRLGVTKMTVSRAMRSDSPVNKETRRRVLEAAEEMGYRPNSAAKAMGSGKFGNVALVTGDNPYYSLMPPMMLRGLDGALAEANVHLTCSHFTNEQLTNSKFVPKIAKSLFVDGMLISYNAKIPARMIELIEECRSPTVWINSRHDHDCVRPDDSQAASAATRSLLELGHTRCAFVIPHRNVARPDEPEHYSEIDRIEGYRKEIASAGLTPLIIGDPNPEQLPENGRNVKELSEHFRHPERPTAVVCYSMVQATRVYAAVLLAGLRIPEDVSLVTFDGEMPGLVPLPIDAMVVPEYAIGQAAGLAMLEKITSPDKPIPSRVLGFTWRCCGSSRPLDSV
ncbi:LacI family DNA-binding transcriptional regulator [Mucisphaera calidilacus]|nr:LacI family DNA-binding transcriptional regulator [Mucisphaera calidilacus]